MNYKQSLTESLKRINHQLAIPGWIQESLRIPTRFRKAETKEEFALDENGIFISGPCGTGKTYLAVGILVAWIRTRPPRFKEGDELEAARMSVPPRLADWVRKQAMFETVAEILLQLRESFQGRHNKSESGIIRQYSKFPFLLLDDLGAEKAGEWSQQEIYLILNNRLNWLRPTIVTSNMSLSEIQAMDARLGSRLASLRQIELQGRDKRIE